MDHQQPLHTMKDAQALVKWFARRNGWDDTPNIDKFDHLHEELIEMSRLLRYQDEQRRQQTIRDQHDAFVDGIGDLLFALCRLANQLEVDIDIAFNQTKDQILRRYTAEHPESTKRS